MKEFELAALDGVKSFLKRTGHHFTPEPGAKCANCDAELAGRYCHVCGQSADNHHRNLGHLIWEGIEGLFHLDGRLWRTLPPLFFRPGLLARDYMQGRLARHVPPFRTFLVSLLLFIFAAEGVIHKIQHDAEHAAQGGHAQPAAGHGEAAKADHGDAKPELTPEERAKVVADTHQKTLAKLIANRDASLARAKSDAERKIITESYQTALIQTEKGFKIAEKTAADEDGASTRNLFSMTPEERRETIASLKTKGDTSLDQTLKSSVAKVIENPKLFILNMFTLGHRMAVLLLPIMSLVLGAIYIYRRQFFIFDHFLVSCNILSFIFLTNALGFVLPEVIRGWWFVLLMVWTPVNIFMTLRGAYGSGVFGALVKTALLQVVTTISFGILMIWLAWLAASAM